MRDGDVLDNRYLFHHLTTITQLTIIHLEIKDNTLMINISMMADFIFVLWAMLCYIIRPQNVDDVMTKKSEHPRENFTHTFLKQLRPADGATQAYAYYDTMEPKLTLLVHAGGTKTFSVSKKVNGKANKYKLGTFPDMSVEQARRAAKAVLSRIANGEDPQEDKRRYRKEMRMDEFFAAYCADAKKATIGDDKKTYRLYLSDWSSKKLSDIKRSDVRAKMTQVKVKHSEPASNKVHTLIRRLFNVAIDLEAFIGPNPAKGLERYKTISRERFLEAHELPFFFEALPYEQNPVARAYLATLLLTGMRKSEALTLRWQDVDWHRKELNLPKTKNGKPHVVPISVHLENFLQELQLVKENEWVFPGNSKKGHMNEPRKAWIRLLQRARLLQVVHMLIESKHWSVKELDLFRSAPQHEVDEVLMKLTNVANTMRVDMSRAGIPGVCMHDIRRTIASWGAISGMSLPIIGKLLNHKTAATTQIYARLSDAPVRTAIDHVTDIMVNMKPPSAARN